MRYRSLKRRAARAVAMIALTACVLVAVCATARAQGQSAVASRTAAAQTRGKEPDPLMRDPNGVQTRYPGVAKIVGRSKIETREDGRQTIPLYYGSGVYVAEYGPWGIVVTNWHVVCEANETIEAVFPEGSTPARVILRDEKWDLAALLIRKPVGVLPTPLALDVPKIGDELWAGGYGPESGLRDFKLSKGRIDTYVSLDVDAIEEGAGNPQAAPVRELAATKDMNFVDAASSKEELDRAFSRSTDPNAEPDGARALTRNALYETISIHASVRQGDSGGPVFNRYGELAGVVWGSDTRSTMATTSLRLQVFLTQAIRNASLIRARNLMQPLELGLSPDDVDGRVDGRPCPRAHMIDVPMVQAVQIEGVFPISSRPVYVAGNGFDTPHTLAVLEKSATLSHVKSVAEDRMKEEGAQFLPPYPPIFSPTFVCQQRELGVERPEVANSETFVQLDRASHLAVVRERDEAELAMRKIAPPDVELAGLRVPADEQIGANSVAAAAPATPESEPEREPLQITDLEAYALVCAMLFAFYFVVRKLSAKPVRRPRVAKKLRLREE